MVFVAALPSTAELPDGCCDLVEAFETGEGLGREVCNNAIERRELIGVAEQEDAELLDGRCVHGVGVEADGPEAFGVGHRRPQLHGDPDEAATQIRYAGEAI